MDAGAYKNCSGQAEYDRLLGIGPFPPSERGFFSCFIEAGGLFGKGDSPLFKGGWGRTIKKNIKNKG